MENRKGQVIPIVFMWMFLVLGAACFIYYFWMFSYIGFRADALIWIFGGIGCEVASFLSHRCLVSYVPTLRKVIVAVYALFIIGVCILVVMEAVILKSGYQKPSENADYVVVLGAHVNGTKMSMALKYRVEAAYSYLCENPDTQVIVSGGQGDGEDITEAEAMKTYLLEKGIEESRIIEENQSTNTVKNIRFSKAYMSDGTHIVIVTNRFHLYRSLKIGNKQLTGYQVEGLGAKTGNGLVVHYYVREAVAVLKDTVFGNM